MKTKQILGSVIVFASTLLLFSSCTKNMGDMNAKGDRETAQLVPCSTCEGNFIHMVSHRMGENAFFWRGEFNETTGSVATECKQPFNSGGFVTNQFFDISATGGTPFYGSGGGAIGVGDGYINAGETLTLELSACMAGEMMHGFDLTLNGKSTDVVDIEMYNGNDLVATRQFVGIDNIKNGGSTNFGASFEAANSSQYFTKLVFKPQSGRIHWVGYNSNQKLNTGHYPDPDPAKFPYYAPTRFHLVP